MLKLCLLIYIAKKGKFSTLPFPLIILGSEDHWFEGGVVFWPPVCGRERPLNLAEAQQEGTYYTIEIGYLAGRVVCQLT